MSPFSFSRAAPAAAFESFSRRDTIRTNSRSSCGCCATSASNAGRSSASVSHAPTATTSADVTSPLRSDISPKQAPADIVATVITAPFPACTRTSASPFVSTWRWRPGSPWRMMHSPAANTAGCMAAAVACSTGSDSAAQMPKPRSTSARSTTPASGGLLNVRAPGEWRGAAPRWFGGRIAPAACQAARP